MKKMKNIFLFHIAITFLFMLNGCTSSKPIGGGTPGGWEASMNLNGVGVAFASTAGALFIVIMVATLVLGKRTDDPAELAEPAFR